MISFILSISLLTLGFLYFLYKSIRCRKSFYIETYALGSITASIILWTILVFISLFFLDENDYKEQQSIKIYELQSLNDATTIQGQLSGNLFVVTGLINEVPSFSFYQKTSEDSYVLASVNASQALIVEGDFSKPTIEYIEYYEPWFSLKPTVIPFFGSGSSEYNYIFRVPRGSVSSDIKLDGQ